MIKSLPLSFAFVLIVANGLAFAEDKPKQTPEEINKADLEKLSGAWVVTKAEAGGTELPKEFFAEIVLTIDGDKYKVEGIPEGTQSGLLTIDATKDIKEMSIEPKEGPNADKPVKAIYKLEEGKLSICYDLTGQAFPKEFKTEANGPQLLIVYEAKKEDEKKEKAK